MDNHHNFNIDERKLIFGIGFIASMRTLGISLIIPFLSIYAIEIHGATETLAGIAVGIFGISQTLMHIPMGRLSDKWGRKETTLLALSIYLIGTILSGLSRNINHLVLARLITGAGAFSSVTMAWLTEGVDRDKRSSALTYVALSIGISIIIGFTTSPIIAGKISIPSLFFICAALILISIFYIIFFMDNQQYNIKYFIFYNIKFNIDIRKESVLSFLKNHDVLRIVIIAFIGSFSHICIFFTMPLLIKENMEIAQMWQLYVPISIIGTSLMFIFGKKADKIGASKTIRIAILFTIFAALIPIFVNNLFAFIASFIIFFSGHSVMSPILPATISRHPDTQHKGAIMGLLNSSQFIGFSAGGFLSGFMMKYDHRYLFILLILFLIISFVSIIGFKEFKNP